MHARFYNPQTGRFLRIDPIEGHQETPQSWNRYGYALGNPIKYIDPLGLAPCPGLSEVECHEEITVTGEEPRYDPLTGVQGLYDLIAGGRLYFESGPLLIKDLEQRSRFLQETFPRVAAVSAQIDEAAQFLMISGIGPPANGIRGIILASNGTKITGLTRHGINRIIGDSASRAGVKPAAVLDALKNPMKIVEGVDKFGRPFQVFHGANARVVVNPQTGRVVSANPLSGMGAN